MIGNAVMREIRVISQGLALYGRDSRGEELQSLRDSRGEELQSLREVEFLDKLGKRFLTLKGLSRWGLVYWKQRLLVVEESSCGSFHDPSGR